MTSSKLSARHMLVPVLAIVVAVLGACSPTTPHTMYPLDYPWTFGAGNSVTVTDAALSDSFTGKDGVTHAAEPGEQFAILTLDMTLPDERWSNLQEVPLEKTEVNSPTFQADAALTEAINGGDIRSFPEGTSAEVKLVYVVGDSIDSLDNYSIQVTFPNESGQGGWADFILWPSLDPEATEARSL